MEQKSDRAKKSSPPPEQYLTGSLFRHLRSLYFPVPY